MKDHIVVTNDEVKVFLAGQEEDLLREEPVADYRKRMLHFCNEAIGSLNDFISKCEEAPIVETVVEKTENK